MTQTSINRRVFPTRRLTQTLLGGAVLLGASSALAQVCFPQPASLPGLSGAPDWVAPGTVRSELNEPRWAAAPQTGFANDPTANEGLYRIIWDGGNYLTVSMQAPTDPDTVSANDVIYFAFTTDGTTASLAKGFSLQMPTSGSDPMPVSGGQGFNYDSGGGGWSSSLGIPSWVEDEAAWRADATARWGINFRINLSSAGLSSANPFKLTLAMSKRDESDGFSINSITPDPGASPAFYPGTLIVQNPTLWTNAIAMNAGCADGITLQGNQIGTRNVDSMGNPAPNLINISNGDTNRFFASPTIPGTITLFSELFQGKFFVANWGSIAAADAPWTQIENGGVPAGPQRLQPVKNGVAPSASDTTIEFDCPVNSGGKVCNVMPTGVRHQCMYVELSQAPGQTVAFSKATAYRNMEFVPLSDFSRSAEISVKGLKKVFKDDKPRDVFVYVDAKNMPPHGDKQLYLPTDKMAATRRFSEAPPPALVRPQRGQRLAAAATRIDPRKPRQLPLPSTGIGDLAINHQQALGVVWPTYDVHVYYDTGKTVQIGKDKTRWLAPMFPFTYFHSHPGALYGFKHTLKGVAGTVVKQRRPNVYQITVPSEGVAKVTTAVSALEKPLNPKVEGGPGPGPKPGPGAEPGAGPGCPVCPVEKGSHCNCAVPGSGKAGSLAWLAAVAALAALTRRRGRPRVTSDR